MDFLNLFSKLELLNIIANSNNENLIDFNYNLKRNNKNWRNKIVEQLDKGNKIKQLKLINVLFICYTFNEVEY